MVAERENGSVQSLSSTQLERQQVRAFAAGLAALSVGRGDRVGLLMDSGVEPTVSLPAIACLGAVVERLFSGFGVDPIIE